MGGNIKESEGHSFYRGQLPLGCQLCMRGQKMVIFIGGKCSHPSKCSWYCPLSSKRKNSVQIYADELAINEPDEALLEAKLIKALGASITGGDPLDDEDQREVTLFYIEELKSNFGNDFHIHLYTNGTTFSEHIGKALREAGLDEIRFHPARSDFNKIDIAVKLGFKTGAEVPVIPTLDYEEYLWDLIDYLENAGASFLNLNEFEMNEPNNKSLLSKGFRLKEDSIASVAGSEELALKILKNIPKSYALSVHYCPIRLKDGPQLRNRYIRRAESIKYPYEEVTGDGTLVFLEITGKSDRLQKFYKELTEISGVPKNMVKLFVKSGDNSTDLIEKMNLPWFLSEEPTFLDAIKYYELKASVVEILPFRDENAEICESTPINIP